MVPVSPWLARGLRVRLSRLGVTMSGFAVMFASGVLAMFIVAFHYFVTVGRRGGLPGVSPRAEDAAGLGTTCPTPTRALTDQTKEMTVMAVNKALSRLLRVVQQFLHVGCVAAVPQPDLTRVSFLVWQTKGGR